MTKHTPGPWHRADSGNLGLIKGPDGRRICNTSLDGKNSDIWAANTRLISAAPEMLAALKMGVELIRHANRGAFENGVTDSTGSIDEGDVIAGRILDEMCAAIAKAEP